MASTIARKKRLVLGGYFASMQDNDAKKRYLEKLKFTGGIDPYETEKKEWTDDVDLWPSITHINLAMYLVLTPSPYTGDELLNYKSLDCYRNFLSGWVREVLVMPVAVTSESDSEKRVIFGKVFDCIVLQMLVIVNNITVAGKSLNENEREATDSLGSS